MLTICLIAYLSAVAMFTAGIAVSSHWDALPPLENTEGVYLARAEISGDHLIEYWSDGSTCTIELNEEIAA